MVAVNRTPFNTIPEKWAFDPELGPFVRELLHQINQIRIRVGGDGDTVLENQIYLEGDVARKSAQRTYARSDEARFAELTTRPRQIPKDYDSLVAEIATTRRRLTTLEQKLNAHIAEVQSA